MCSKLGAEDQLLIYANIVAIVNISVQNILMLILLCAAVGVQQAGGRGPGARPHPPQGRVLPRPARGETLYYIILYYTLY